MLPTGSTINRKSKKQHLKVALCEPERIVCWRDRGLDWCLRLQPILRAPVRRRLRRTSGRGWAGVARFLVAQRAHHAASPECTARWERLLLETFRGAGIPRSAGPIRAVISGFLAAKASTPLAQAASSMIFGSTTLRRIHGHGRAVAEPSGATAPPTPRATDCLIVANPAFMEHLVRPIP